MATGHELIKKLFHEATIVYISPGHHSLYFNTFHTAEKDIQDNEVEEMLESNDMDIFTHRVNKCGAL